MRLARRLDPEKEAWRRLVAAWDASLGELKTKVDRAQAKADEHAEHKENDDERR